MARRGFDSGPANYGPVRSKFRSPTQSRELEDESLNWNPRARVDQMWDFIGIYDSTATLGEGLTSAVAGTTPTVAQVANSINGLVALTLTSTSEAQSARIDTGDVLNFDPTKQPMIQAYIKTFGTAFTSVQNLVFGFASAYNATLDSVASNMWFKLAGSNVLRVEGDDGTTDTDDQTTGRTLAVSTWYLLTVFARTLNRVEFWLDDDMVGTVSVPLLTATQVLQPALILQKASGTTVPAVQVDYIRASQNRW